MKAQGLPLTCIITPCFYEQLLVPPLRPKQLDRDSFGFGEYTRNTRLNKWSSHSARIKQQLLTMEAQSIRRFKNDFTFPKEKNVTVQKYWAIVNTLNKINLHLQFSELHFCAMLFWDITIFSMFYE